MEGLDRAILTGLQQQLAMPAAQGGLDPTVVARIASHRAANPGMYLHDAVIEVHKQMQAEQAAQSQQMQAGGGEVPGAQPPGAPAQPGMNAPPAGMPSTPPAPQGQMDLSQIMATLHRPVQQSAPERALAG